MKLHCVCLALATLLPVFDALAGPTLDRVRATRQVVIAYREASIPFSYVDAEGQPIGYAIDLCKQLVDALSNQLGVGPLKIRYVPVTSSNRIETIEAERADLGCESTTNTAERRQRVSFTVPHYVTGTRFLVRADSPVVALRDFAGRRLVSTTGTAPLDVLRSANAKHELGIRLGEVADHARGVEAVARGEADGFAMDEVLIQGLVAALPEPGRLKVVGKYLTVEALAIMLPRNDAEFKGLIDSEMKRLIRNRTAHALHDRWFTQPIPPQGRNLNLPMPFLLRDSWRFPTDWVPPAWAMP
ncbi:amino acid ABC transporter substrate-binding protein [Rubrivivax sp. RP6-9]|uniref:amino acid ABC transporter substrate-binding protein n=1 Tax=Rubrivivax sp. RP6-9 TaxID=3415750 RepID=UPI003CC58CA7